MFYLPDLLVSERAIFFKSPTLIMAFVNFSIWFWSFLFSLSQDSVVRPISQNSKLQVMEIDLGLLKQKKYLPELLGDLKRWDQHYPAKSCTSRTAVMWGSHHFHCKAIGVAPQCLEYLTATAAVISIAKMLPSEVSLPGAPSLLEDFVVFAFPCH